MGAFWTAFIIAYSVGGNQFALATAKAEVRIVELLGPHGETKEACMAYADSQRQRVATTWKLADRRILKYDCVQAPLSTN